MAANLLDNDQRRVSDGITAYALYTDPPLGRAGMTEAEVRKIGKPALISTMAMEDVSRAREKGETKGFMKVLVDRDSKQILGASLLGLAGDEVIHCILDLMYAAGFEIASGETKATSKATPEFRARSKTSGKVYEIEAKRKDRWTAPTGDVNGESLQERA